MDPIGFIPYFEKTEIMAEIEISGRFMMMAADIEWSMLHIIIYSAPDPNIHHRANQFQGMMMNEKIECTICDLRKNKVNYYNEYKEYLDMLIEFKDVRNDMGHYKLEFKDDTFSSFKMLYVGSECGELKICYKTYTLVRMMEIITRFRKANLKFMELVQKLESDFHSTKNNIDSDL